MVGYYDAVLGIIPLVMFGLAGGLYAIGMTLGLAVILGGTVAAGVIAHAMFVRAPIDDAPKGSADLAAD